MRERWGTLSVKDHVSDTPLVTEVLLFDRLVVPVPEWNDAQSVQRWKTEGWQPEQLHDCLDILRVKTDTADGLALAVPWDQTKEDRFTQAMSTAAAIATQQREPDKPYYCDPFNMTRQLIRDEFLPALPRGVSKAWPVANFASADQFREQLPNDTIGRNVHFALTMSHEFLTPIGKDINHDMLRRAVDLSTSDAFRGKRQAFYSWQEGIVEENISDEKAIEEMEQQLKALDEATRRAFRETITKYVFTLVPIGLALLGAHIEASEHARLIAGSAGIAELIRFWKFDRRRNISSGDCDGAAMIHDARKVLPLERDKAVPRGTTTDRV